MNIYSSWSSIYCHPQVLDGGTPKVVLGVHTDLETNQYGQSIWKSPENFLDHFRLGKWEPLILQYSNVFCVGFPEPAIVSTSTAIVSWKLSMILPVCHPSFAKKTCIFLKKYNYPNTPNNPMFWCTKKALPKPGQNMFFLRKTWPKSTTCFTPNPFRSPSPRRSPCGPASALPPCVWALQGRPCPCRRPRGTWPYLRSARRGACVQRRLYGLRNFGHVLFSDLFN